MIDAFVEQRFRYSLSLRRSRPDIASIATARGAGQLNPDHFLQRVRNAAFVEAGVPGHEHRLAQVDIVPHHGVKAGIGGAVLEALDDIGLELGLPQLLDIQHRDVRHDRLPGESSWNGIDAGTAACRRASRRRHASGWLNKKKRRRPKSAPLASPDAKLSCPSKGEPMTPNRWRRAPARFPGFAAPAPRRWCRA